MSIFLHYKGVCGECTDPNHKDWIDVESVEWGVSRRITSNSGTGKDRESANAEIKRLVIGRRMDKATPGLVLAVCCGTGRTATIHLTKTGSGEGADVYAEYTLRNAIVSGYSVLKSARGRRRPVERIVISFVDPEVRYIPYDEDGAPEAPIAVGFSITENRKF